MSSRVWIRHIGSWPGLFRLSEDRLVDMVAVCKFFRLDPSAKLTISNTPVEIINGMSDQTVDDILEQGIKGEDGSTRATALTIKENRILRLRYCDAKGATHMVKLPVDGVFDLQTLCHAFSLDPSEPLVVAGIALTFTDKGKSTITARTISEEARRDGLTQDGLSQATAFVVEGSPVKTRGVSHIPSKFGPICAVPSPSYEVCSLERIERCFNRKLFKDMRAEHGMPIAIAARAFGLFIDHLKADYNFQLRDFNLAKKLREQMSLFYPTEESRRLAFVQLLKSYLEHDGIYRVVDKREAVESKTGKRQHPDSAYINRTPDIQVKTTIYGVEVVVFTCEVKPEMGFNGEPCMEALFYYGDDAAQSSLTNRHYCTGCPELLGELVGPNFRLGGVVYHDKPTYEPLTDYISLLPFVDEAHLFKLMRLLSALRAALDAIAGMVRKALAPNTPSFPDAALSWPYGLREKYPDAVDVIQILDKLLYVLTTSRHQRVIKFVQRYGANAHEQWEAAGYAPEHTIHELPGGWKMVDMKCLTLADGWHLMLELDPKRRETRDELVEQVPAWGKIQAAAWEALKTLQQLQPLMVHGDLRLNNIMYNIRTGKVCFLDFDWAGEEKKVQYPLLLSPDIQWPSGVGPNQEITAAHDRELLRQELGMLGS